jgi:hypothetical protein
VVDPVVLPEVVPVVVLPEVVPEVEPVVVLPEVLPDVVPVVELPEVLPEVLPDAPSVPVVAQEPRKPREAHSAVPSSREIFVRFIFVEMKGDW